MLDICVFSYAFKSEWRIGTFRLELSITCMIWLLNPCIYLPLLSIAGHCSQHGKRLYGCSYTFHMFHRPFSRLYRARHRTVLGFCVSFKSRIHQSILLFLTDGFDSPHQTGYATRFKDLGTENVVIGLRKSMNAFYALFRNWYGISAYHNHATDWELVLVPARGPKARWFVLSWRYLAHFAPQVAPKGLIGNSPFNKKT